MARGFERIVSIGFTMGWTGPVGTVLGQGASASVVPVTFPRMEDVELLPSGRIRPRPNFEEFLSLGERIDYLDVLSSARSSWTLVVATPSRVRFYDLSLSGLVTLRREVLRGSDLPVTSVGYQGDVWFTADATGYFYDPETTLVYQIGLPKPPSAPTVTSTGQAASLRGKFSYVITYLRKVGSRYETEGPASDPTGITLAGVAAQISWSTPPTGLGITGVAIYRAEERNGVLGPYLLVDRVGVGVTSYTDTKDSLSLGGAIFTLGVEAPQANVVSLLLDHLMLADEDRVWIASPFRPEVFRPGFDLAMDEGREPMGEIRALVPMKNRMAVIKRDAIYEIVVSGSPNVPFLRGVVVDGVGADSPYGATTTNGLDLLLATGSGVYLLGGEGGQQPLGPLLSVYRQLPEDIRRRVAARFFADREWLLIGLTNEMWVRMLQAWSRWTIPATAIGVLTTTGENVLIVGTADGKVGFLRGRKDSARVTARVVSPEGSLLVGRRIFVVGEGHGEVGLRLGEDKPLRFLPLSTKEGETAVVDTPVYGIGPTLDVDIHLSGDVELVSFGLDGRIGRKIVSAW